MNNQLATLYRFNLRLCESLMADITDDEMLHQHHPKGNPPAWILGHLAVVNDMLLNMLGQPTRCPDAWTPMFGPRSEPLPDREACPSRDELLTAVREGFQATAALLEDETAGIDPSAMTDANPIEPLRAALPTQGDLVRHILSTHASFHLGFLSSWRRQMGRPPLF